MKATRWDDFIYGTELVSRRKSDLKGSDESLFSLLLELESSLNGSVELDSQPGFGGSKPSKLRGLKRSKPSSLSRYVE